MIAMQEVEIADLMVTVDLEEQSLPSQGPVIKSADTPFTPDEIEDNANDLEMIIASCIKNMKRCNIRHAIKSLTHLVAMSEYVKLYAHYRNMKACQWRCLSASLTIACQMGKGPYFAHQIRHNELYLLWNCQLPPPRSYIRHGHHTLLDNESLLHNTACKSDFSTEEKIRKSLMKS